LLASKRFFFKKEAKNFWFSGGLGRAGMETLGVDGPVKPGNDA
jgi:hypothetical protein